MPRNLRRTADGPSTLGPRGRDVASEPGELQAGDAPVPESLEKASVKTSVKTIDALLELLRQKPPITRADVAVQVGRTVRAVEMASAKPVKAGRLRFAGGSDSARLPHAPESSGRNWGRLPRSGWDGICSRRMGVGDVGGDEEPRGSGGERRFSEGPPGAGGDTGAYGPTTAARRSRSGIKKLFGELKRETCGTSNQRARKSRKRVDHQKEADLNPHQQERSDRRIG